MDRSFDCPVWQDGIDLKPCFSDRYLSFLLPLALVGSSIAIALINRLVHVTTRIRLPDNVDASLGDAPLSPVALEDEVLLASGRQVFGAEPEEGKSTVELARDYGILVLLLVLLGVELYRGVNSSADVWGPWGGVALAAYLVVLSALSTFNSLGFEINHLEAHRTSLLCLYGLVALVNLRSSILRRNDTSPSSLPSDALACAAILALFLLDVSTPYRAVLDGSLTGHRARGTAFHLARGANSPEVGDSSSTQRPLPGLEEPRSLFSRATFFYMNRLTFRHYKRPITETEIPDLREDDRAAVVVAGWRAYREKHNAKMTDEERSKNYVKGSLSWSLLCYFKSYFALQALWSAFFVLCSFIAPWSLKSILQFIAYRKLSLLEPDVYPPQPTHLAVTYVIAMFLGQVLASISHGYALWLGRRICVRLRAIIVTECFGKALRRTDAARVARVFDQAAQKASADPAAPAQEEQKDVPADEDASEGKILNLVSSDAMSISEIAAYLLYVFPECPLSIALSVTFLYRLLGVSAAVGIATLIAITPVQTWLAAWFVKVQNKLLAASDARMNLVTEVLGAIRLVKFNAWESRFYARMSETRRKELTLLKTRFVAWTFQGMATTLAPVAVTCVTFAFHTKILQRPLSTETAFTALALFNMLRSPLEALTDMSAHVLSAHVSTNRVQAFLQQAETEKYTNLTPSDKIGFKNATLRHASGDDAPANDIFTLQNLDFTFPKGELSLVAGSVGSGKTTLLLSLLGETTLVSGNVLMHEHYSRETAKLDPQTGLSQTVAYCSQQPWLMGATIKENIVFGSAVDETRYRATLKACQLERDLAIFELGDATEVGEKGTACSGGQKARISLARALYSRSATLILDDILSAVDAHTAAFLFKNCLKGPLMKGRTVILVTHAVGLCLPGAAFAVVLENGSVLASGPPKDLRSKNVFDENDLADHAEDDAHHKTEEVQANEDGSVPVAVEQQLSSDPAADEAQKQADIAKLETKKLVKDEESATGAISAKIYALYIGAMGSLLFWVALVAVFFGSQGLQVGVNFWLQRWAKSYDPQVESASFLTFMLAPVAQSILALSPSDDESNDVSILSSFKDDQTNYYLAWYLVLNLIYLVSIAVRMGWLFFGSLRASAILYDKLLLRVLGARVRFFDSTPSGRILNRFSKDVSSIDQEAAPILLYLLQSILSCLAVLMVISFITPPFIIGALLIVGLYSIIGALYLSLSRELKRLDSVTRSPIFVAFGECLQGMVSIRSYGDNGRFTRSILERVDNNNAPFLLLWQSNRWLSVWCDSTGALVSLFAGVFVLLTPALGAGVAGLSLSYAVTFTDSVLWIVRLYSASEQNMNSVERISQYLDLEAEEEVDAKGQEPLAAWPQSGSIKVRNLTATYHEALDPVLKNVSFEVLPNERVGICGRTGSGKSTLALTFFRFLEASSGSIEIDGLDIAKMSLSTLRSRLTIIPQESILFSGSIRDNLDPFDLADDDHEIWEALVNVRMASWSTPSASASRKTSRAASRANSMTDLGKLGEDGEYESDAEGEELSQITSLDQAVAAGGRNFSAGERQLLALARGLLKLKHSNILLLDESTANLDSKSDAAIQKTLTENLVGVTMLIIAHRLRTVIECDKILMLDAGRVLEYGPPSELMQKEGGAFRSLCEQSGEYATLLETAKAAHDGRQLVKL